MECYLVVEIKMVHPSGLKEGVCSNNCFEVGGQGWEEVDGTIASLEIRDRDALMGTDLHIVESIHS